MQILTGDPIWRILWGFIGFLLSGLSAHHAVLTGSAASWLSALGFAAWGVTWIILPIRLNVSPMENFRRNRACVAQLSRRTRLSVAVGFWLGLILIGASLIATTL